MAHLSDTGLTRTERLALRVLREIGRALTTALITAPLVVPIWWAMWKVCDVLWGMK